MSAPIVPARPAAYIRVACANPDDLAVQRQKHAVLRAAGAIANGQHDAVITHDLARISRRTADIVAFARHCAGHGTAFELVRNVPIIHATGFTSHGSPE